MRYTYISARSRQFSARLGSAVALAAGLAAFSAEAAGPAGSVSSAPAPEVSGNAGGAKPSPSADADTPTYLRDVLPIFMGKCSRCHNSQTRFVYNWLDYKSAHRDRSEIKRRIWDSWKGRYYKEAMPIENSPESFAITPDERETIRKWVAAGSPIGSPALTAGPKTKAERIEAGKRLFNSICAACHQAGGQGVPKLFPPLAGSDFLNADKNRAIAIVLNGRQGEVVVNGTKFNNTMPSFPLGDDDIASVLTFVYNSFGNSGFEVTPEEVNALRPTAGANGHK